jgi:predicted nucleotidyltransferase
MKVVAVIAEYNPFHNGHAYQIGQIKNMLPDCVVIAVMSGSLVQRGEFAVISKYERARAAVLCGVDAVFELPSVYSCAPANLFARAAVNIIKNLGGVDYICFGSETGDLDLLEFAAEKSENIKLDGNSRDKNYPGSFYGAFKNLYGEEKARVFKGSNDILGIEYLRALKKSGSGIAPMAVKRTGGDYMTSASIIRACVRENNFYNLKNFMPEKSFGLLFNLIKSGKTADINNISPAVISHINRLEPREIAQFAEIHGGFEYKIKKSCANLFNYDELIKDLQAKHATASQVRRMILNIFFEITRAEQQAAPGFANLLCANETGREYLNKIRKSADIIIAAKPADFTGSREYAKNIFIDNIYKLALFNKAGEINAVKEKPVIL